MDAPACVLSVRTVVNLGRVQGHAQVGPHQSTDDRIGAWRAVVESRESKGAGRDSVRALSVQVFVDASLPPLFHLQKGMEGRRCGADCTGGVRGGVRAANGN